MPRDVHGLIHPVWPPVQHIERGWDALSPEEQGEVTRRVETVLSGSPISPTASRTSLSRFFTFLAQVETIAIEIPMRFLPTAPDHLRPLLRRQLVDEVFHSCLFTRLAYELSTPAAVPDAPIPAAEELLTTIRREEDLAVSATLLNLVAEGWIEGMFRHAVTWGVADRVFAAVLEDESRHVDEAHAYQGDLDAAKARAALDRLEAGLLRLGEEPTVALAMIDLAGEERYRAMVRDLFKTHRAHLAEVGLEPGTAWAEFEAASGPILDRATLGARGTPVPDTAWRAVARRTWDVPRHPAMQGAFDLRVGRIPKRVLTATIVAAIGRAWAAHPELNRVAAKGRIWQLPRVNVGVRVAIGEGELATVVVTDADRRSIRDIQRMIVEGASALQIAAESRAGDARTFDPRVFEALDPGEEAYAVAVSNAGRYGLVSGAGALSGALSPATDVTIGERRRLPAWFGIAYIPAWHATLGCVQDHRVFDGREAGLAMRAVREGLSRRGYRDLRRAPDTLDPATPPVATLPGLPPELNAVASAGLVKYLPIIVAGGAAAGAAGVGAYYYIKHRREKERETEEKPSERPGA